MSKAFASFLKENLKTLPEGFESTISPQLISGKSIELPKKVLNQFQECVSQVWTWQKTVPRKNFGVCNSFDFHLDQNQNPKLIEVNTNAAFLALGYYLSLFMKSDFPIEGFSLNQWVEDCRSEMRLFNGSSGKLKIAIVDEQPETQRLYIEFLVFKAFLDSLGIESYILDPSQLEINNNKVYFKNNEINFIYNRSTDFLFETSNSKNLKYIYENNLACISPHPEEYSAIADKQLLIKWSLENPESPFLLKCWNIQADVADELWTKRKKLFIKPKNSFGSKQSYRGESISRNVFVNLVDKGFIAQEFCPAPEFEFEENGSSIKLKADFRVYVYQDKIEHVMVRLYQGQVTNLRTEGGGFATVSFK